MRKITRGVLSILLSFFLAALLTGCALRSLFGNVIIVEDIENEVNEIITTVFSDSTAAVCLSTDYGFYECTYIIDGDIITSTLYLLSEFGITGVLIDPLILQVPADVSKVKALYDDGSGDKPLSVINTGHFQVMPGTAVTAEVGQKFLILELPSSVTNNLPEGNPSTAPEFSYSLSFTRTQPITSPIQPMNIKMMLAGKVTVRGHNYYVPTLPCVTDFASIPALGVPQSNTLVNLQPAVGALLQQGNAVCDHEGYYFDNVPPPPHLLYLPFARH
jgi:hypothetical protein